MPKHIVSGLKYLATLELKKHGYNQNQIAQELNMNRSTVSHYLNGRNITPTSIDFAQKLTEINTRDFITLTNELTQDPEQTKKLVLILKQTKTKANIKDSCIACGMCVSLCPMKSIKIENLKAQINSKTCCGCLECQEACPTQSIKIIGGK